MMIFTEQLRLDIKSALRLLFVLIAAIILSACDQPEKVSPVSLLLPDAEDAPKRDQVPAGSLHDQKARQADCINHKPSDHILL